MSSTEVEYVPIDETPKSRAGRKTNEERERRRIEAEREARRAKRIFADTPGVLWVLLTLVSLLAVASFSVSFAGLYAAGEWVVGKSWLQVAVPFMLDGAIIAFTIALFIERERGESVLWTWVAITVFASVSSVSNVLHTLAVSTASTGAQLIAGCVIAGGAPLLLAFAIDKAAIKVFREVERG